MCKPIEAILSCALVLVLVGSAQAFQDARQSFQWDEEVDGPLPRWREGGTPPVDPSQRLEPYAVAPGAALHAPTSGIIESPPEYAPCAGVLFRYSTGAWPVVVTDCVVALTRDPNYDEIAYVVVSSASQQAAATSQFTAAGADMSKVEFAILPTDSIWLRDYGPHFIWQSGPRAIVDSHYYPTRPQDNFIPTLLADDEFLIPSYDIGLYYSGGNFQPGADGSGFTTTLVNQDNPGHGDAFIAELYQQYQGIDVLHIMPRLPSSVDATGHIDMWLYLIDEDTVIISEFLPGSNPTAIEVTENAVVYMEDLGYEVFRVPDHNGYHPYDPGCHFTYTNAFRVNDRIFIPAYGHGNPDHFQRDAEAVAAFQAAAPEAQIVPIDSYDIIWAAGAIHCIIMQVPRYEDPNPAAHVVSPDGGELLVSGTDHGLAWAAVDDDEVTSVDLAYSTDGGSTFPYSIATGEVNDGQYDWTVPETLTAEAIVRVQAHDGDGNASEAVSESAFAITGAPQTVYDFSSGAGVDKWAWGYQTTSWSSLNRIRRPAEVAFEIEDLQAGAIAKIAASDATGGDNDANRYVAPTPTGGRESTHLFEFLIDEDPSVMLDVGMFWEGYGDSCLQMELYVWDVVEGDWCDAAGRFGENRYLANFAGNRDEVLSGHIQSDFDRFLDVDGLLTFLLYAERSSQESFHDYVSVIVTYTTLGDIDGDGRVGTSDLLILLSAWGECPPLGGCPSDLDGSGFVGTGDLLILLANWG
ncbi:MAG: agmatine deiminase family protein [Planctomycetota bacterium]|jgi:agmatine/peptidylarginine deiminase